MSLWGTTTIKKQHREIDEDTQARIISTRELASKITLMIPHRAEEGIHPQMIQYLLPWANAGIEIRCEKDAFGGFIDLFRARMCKMFLRETDRRFLVMLDQDVVPRDPEGILRLCANDLPVVSGIACAFRPGTGLFAVVGVKDDTGIARFPTTMDTKVLPGSGVREIQSCGAGMLAIRRDVLESMRDEPFLLSNELRLEAIETGILRKSEDIWFGDQVRDAGFKLFVDFSVHCFHDKMIPLHWDTESIDDSLDPEDWDVTSSALAVVRK